MKNGIIFNFLLIILTVFLVGCAEIEPEEQQLENWEPVTKKVVDQYFHQLNHPSLQACDKNVEKIEEKEEGFRLERYGENIYVTRVYVDYDYKWNHDGDYLYVDLICDYDVSFVIPPFIAGNDELRVYQGTYKMKKHYNQETKRLVSLSFE